MAGNCKASTKDMKMYKGTHETINVTLNYACELSVNKETVAQFSLMLGAQIHGIASNNSLDFHVVSFNHTTVFTPYQDYKVENEELAQHMVTHSLNRLFDHRVFGSGWVLYPRDYPHFVVEDNYTTIYDSTHVDPSLIQEVQ